MHYIILVLYIKLVLFTVYYKLLEYYLYYFKLIKLRKRIQIDCIRFNLIDLIKSISYRETHTLHNVNRVLLRVLKMISDGDPQIDIVNNYICIHP